MTTVPPHIGGPDDPQPMVIPHTFTQAGDWPVHISIEPGVPGPQGSSWCGLRIETVHGSYVVFLVPEIAETVGQQLTDGAKLTRETKPPLILPDHDVPDEMAGAVHLNRQQRRQMERRKH